MRTSISGRSTSIPDFWAAMWEFAEIKASKKYDRVIDDLKKIPGGEVVSRGEAQFCRESPAVSG